MDEATWNQLRLSLERPYKDDVGNQIPNLLDILPDETQIYEPKETPSKALENNFRRIFLERGFDFFDQRDISLARSGDVQPQPVAASGSASGDPSQTAVMTVQDLNAMRAEVVSQLDTALGEMSQTRDLLNDILSNTAVPTQSFLVGAHINQPNDKSPSLMTATIVTNPPPITSVQAFNGQLAIGRKDEALRKASKLLRVASDSMDRSRLRGERYWVDALRSRRANWGLSPAPLPLGSAVGKGADKTSKDFVISYGLEGSPAPFRQRAIAQLVTTNDAADDLTFPFHQNTRLRISVITDHEGNPVTSVFNSPMLYGSIGLDTALKNSQVEIVDQEIFSFLVKEAGNLPTASAQVSERLIILSAAQGLCIRFELVDYDEVIPATLDNSENPCELIYYVLHVLLIRMHNVSIEQHSHLASHKKERPFAVLQPIIDILQYSVFCDRIQIELRKTVTLLEKVGVPSKLRFTAVGESGERLIALLSEQGDKNIGGEAVLHVDDWQILRFTFASPSTLRTHLPQATIDILSMPQLGRLLMDEIDRCFLQKICTLGRQLCQNVDAIWFVDLNKCVGRWEGCVLNFQLSYTNMTLHCSAFRLDGTTGKSGIMIHYPSDGTPLLQWVEKVIHQVSQ